MADTSDHYDQQWRRLQNKVQINLKKAEADCQPYLLLPRLIFSKYDPVFNFFFSKPISDICECTDTTEAKLLRELGYFDSDNQFLKRFYKQSQVPERVQLLYEIHHPQQLWKVQSPTIACHTGRKYIAKLIKRQKKLARKLAELQEEEPEEFQSKFLSSMREPASNSSNHNNVTVRSYDSSVHDIYSQYTDPPEESIVGNLSKCFTCLPASELQEEWGGVDGPGHLTVDFDDIDEENILYGYTKLKDKHRNSKGNDQNYTYLRPRSPAEKPLLYHSKIPINPSPPIQAETNLSPSKRAEKMLALRALKKQIESSNQDIPKQLSPSRMGSGYISPRLNELSNYSKKVFGRTPLVNNVSSGSTSKNPISPIDSSLEGQDYRHLEKALAGTKSFQAKAFNNFVNSREYDRNYYRQQQDRGAVGYVSSHAQQPAHTNSFRSPEFDQIRRRAIELIQDQKNYYVQGRLGSPKYDHYRRNYNNY